MSLESRLSAVRELMIGDMREDIGLHSYDAVLQDFSPSAIDARVAALGSSGPEKNHDEQHLAAFENGLRWFYGDYQAHRRDPHLHIGGLDLACYDRLYAPEAERAAAKARHLAQWPAAIDVAVTTLDNVPAPVAAALVSAARGLAAVLDTRPAAPTVVEQARTAHARLVAHLEHLATTGDPECAVGEATLASFLGAFEGFAQPVDVTRLAAVAQAETDRLQALLTESCARLSPGVPTAEVIAGLLADHPGIEGVIAEARTMTAEVLAFTAEHHLTPFTDGECLVGPAPESRKWAMAMMSWAGPEEADAPSWYHVTPPEPTWPADEISEWLSVFSRTTLPAITIHEVAPGHYAHSRSLRRATSPVRRQLVGMAFAEGWAHYAEEMVAEVGFRADDPRYVVGLCLEALVRSTRLACSIGLHTGALSVDDATRLFETNAHLGGSAARAEARRGSFDIGYGRYTQGKLAVLDLREEARQQWGSGFTLPRFHEALLGLGSPPLGLLGAALAE